MKNPLAELSIAPGEKGGHVVTHHFRPTVTYKRGAGGMGMDHRPPQQHIFGKGENNKVLAHIAQALGLKQAAADEGAEE